MRRVALAVLLASLVVVAGCGGTGGTETETSTDMTTPSETATPSPTATPTSDTLDSVEYPDGAAADGLTDPTAIASSQRGLLNDTSYTLVYEAEATSGPQEGNTAFVRTTYTPDRSVTNIATSQDGVGSNVTIFSGADATVLRSSNESTTGYAYYERNSSFVASFYRFYGLQVPGQFTGQFLQAFEYEAVDTEQRDGHTYIVYESTGVNQSFVDRSGTTEYTEGDLRLVLRDDGLVTGLEGSATATTQEGETTREVSYEVTDVGATTVERPTWLEETVPAVSAEPVGDGKVLAITNEGPSDLDAGSIGVSLSISGQTEFDGLAAGETVYVTATQDGGSLNLTVHDERPTTGEDNIDFSAAERVVVSVQSQPFQFFLDGQAEEE